MAEVDDIAETVRTFFATVGGASLELSDGWFGRPYDNHHRLRGVDVDGTALLIGIDERQLLTLRGPTVAEVDWKVLLLRDYESAEWDWTAYGSSPARRHRRALPPGMIRFHGF